MSPLFFPALVQKSSNFFLTSALGLTTFLLRVSLIFTLNMRIIDNYGSYALDTASGYSTTSFQTMLLTTYTLLRGRVDVGSIPSMFASVSSSFRIPMSTKNFLTLESQSLFGATILGQRFTIYKVSFSEWWGLTPHLYIIRVQHLFYVLDATCIGSHNLTQVQCFTSYYRNHFIPSYWN